MHDKKNPIYGLPREGGTGENPTKLFSPFPSCRQAEKRKELVSKLR
jgi:hypothetical protein